MKKVYIFMVVNFIYETDENPRNQIQIAVQDPVNLNVVKRVQLLWQRIIYASPNSELVKFCTLKAILFLLLHSSETSAK